VSAVCPTLPGVLEQEGMASPAEDTCRRILQALRDRPTIGRRVDDIKVAPHDQHALIELRQIVVYATVGRCPLLARVRLARLARRAGREAVWRQLIVDVLCQTCVAYANSPLIPFRVGGKLSASSTGAGRLGSLMIFCTGLLGSFSVGPPALVAHSTTLSTRCGASTVTCWEISPPIDQPMMSKRWMCSAEASASVSLAISGTVTESGENPSLVVPIPRLSKIRTRWLRISCLTSCGSHSAIVPDRPMTMINMGPLPPMR
jgi:hypothetical protein